MQLKVFAIYDRAAEAFNTPFFMLTSAEAIRAFTNMATNPESQIYHNPLDFELHNIGHYINTTGDLLQDDALGNLGSAAIFKEKAEKVVPIKEAN